MIVLSRHLILFRLLLRNNIDVDISFLILQVYTLWIARCIATARERIPGSIDNYVTGVSECSQQRGNLKDDGYICGFPLKVICIIKTVELIGNAKFSKLIDTAPQYTAGQQIKIGKTMGFLMRYRFHPH
ncbi:MULTISPECIES: hypothetical protein [Photorhabdus]|uniref:Uncharacterized protein n=2 Tax=Photorhabdus TaxID=29487 RepID=A0ABX0B6S7_9GAMM|nr:MULTISPECIES: hypothetical protein [Photorhabdus]MCC8374484.1 hypothetical protein [Photorhabdus bodei]MCT8353050.1 hypothetical protein [Photorhabdus kayaii]MDB6369383.1 hypothetical protein [Photorhabdus bodei]NDL13827.1 hypothetical protein [Photorhabdus kayaii]NDL27343.1 hypothetical protein [Photorhabdus kayaii]